jgi:hypothetical protein
MYSSHYCRDRDWFPYTFLHCYLSLLSFIRRSTSPDAPGSMIKFELLLYFFLSFLILSTVAGSVHFDHNSVINTSTTSIPQPRVLFFDTFGTVVSQGKPVADELWKSAQESLQLNSTSISNDVRAKATEMV